MISVKRLSGTSLPQSTLKTVFTGASGQHDLGETCRGRGDVWSVRTDGLVLSTEAEAGAADCVSAPVYQHCLSARKSYHRLGHCQSIFCLSTGEM